MAWRPKAPGTSSKAPAPAPPQWQVQTAARADALEGRREGEVGPARYAREESKVLRKGWQRDSKRIAEDVLRLPRGVNVEFDAVTDFIGLAAALASHARWRLACKPLRFEPTDTTRIIEGRPVQAFSAPCLTVGWSRAVCA